MTKLTSCHPVCPFTLSLWARSTSLVNVRLLLPVTEFLRKNKNDGLKTQHHVQSKVSKMGENCEFKDVF
jgi:hypothetical protein